jgi:hypothetical protein
MTMRAVLQTLKAACQDPATGLAAQALAIAAAEGIDPGIIRTDFHYEPWYLSGQPSPTGQPNIAIEPRRTTADLEIPAVTQRDADQVIVFAYEYFYHNGLEIQDNITVIAAAFLKVLDRLREYSDANGGTVVEVQTPVTLDIGTYIGSPVAGGFQATVTISERGTI